MLDQIIMPCPISFNISHYLSYNVKLMESWEYELVPLETDELLYNIHHAVCIEYMLPQIVSRIAIRIGRISFSSIITGTIATLVEWQEICLLAGKFCCHPCFGKINTEERKYSFVELEAYLPWISICLPLLFGVLYTLASELVLKLKSKHRNTVYSKDHIYAILIICAVMPLAYAVKYILLIVFYRGLIKTRFRHKVTHTKLDASMLESVAQDIQNPFHITGIIESKTELLLRIHCIHIKENLFRTTYISRMFCLRFYRAERRALCTRNYLKREKSAMSN